MNSFLRFPGSLLVAVGLLTFAGCTKKPLIKREETVVPSDEPALTHEPKVRRATIWENSGTASSFAKPTGEKIAKAKKWETGGGEARGRGLGKGMSVYDAGGSPAKPASPAGSGGGLGAGFGGSADKAAESSALRSAPHAKMAGPRLRESRDHRSYQLVSDNGILTAGSFDDGDDIQVFQKFWNGSELLRSADLGQLERADWSKRRKKADSRRHTRLQLAFVVDTTGSMGDELEYLKNEFKSIVSEIDRSYPAVEKEIAFIAYRDQGDEYVTRGLNFTTDMNQVHEFINDQSANGGGDYPEAVATALEESYVRLTWDANAATARMMFFIADAPAHNHEMTATFKAVEKLAGQNVNVFPVAASGVMDVAEAMMRATALLTGGRYIFLTDDSGVGLSHAAPKHPCYNVELLKDIMVREIKDRIGGTRTFPVAKNVIRHGGDRSAGYCRTHKQVVGQW
jgi:Mg-chelatase subunit ChlD